MGPKQEPKQARTKKQVEQRNKNRNKWNKEIKMSIKTAYTRVGLNRTTMLLGLLLWGVESGTKCECKSGQDVMFNQAYCRDCYADKMKIEKRPEGKYKKGDIVAATHNSIPFRGVVT